MTHTWALLLLLNETGDVRSRVQGKELSNQQSATDDGLQAIWILILPSKNTRDLCEMSAYNSTHFVREHKIGGGVSAYVH